MFEFHFDGGDERESFKLIQLDGFFRVYTIRKTTWTGESPGGGNNGKFATRRRRNVTRIP